MPRNFFTIHLVTFAVIGCLLLPTRLFAAEADNSIEAGKQIFSFGSGSQVPACQKCHGPNGLGSDDVGTPRIASQVYTYLLKQLVNFASDKRTDDYMHQMNAIAKALSDQQRKDVAAYLHSLKWPYSGSDLAALARAGIQVGDPVRGRTIVKAGIRARGVPPCQSCHGYDGQSAGSLFPTLSGQNYTYLTHELASFKRGSRHNDFMGQMRAVATKLDERDIRDVAAFLTGAKPPPPPDNPNDPGAKPAGGL